MRIFYVVFGEFVAGGQLVNLAHVTALRALGLDARLMIVRPSAEPFEPKFPSGVTPPPWQIGAEGLLAGDVVVVGEMFTGGARAVMGSSARKVIHNQNPHYLFQAFSHVGAIEQWGAAHMICASNFTAQMTRAAGWTRPMSVVRPFIDPRFRADPDTPRRLAVAVMPRKRQVEWRLIRGLLWSRRPDLQNVPWISIVNADTDTCATALRSNEIFLSLSYQEGLGLPPLEAMASGALVVGFHGLGGREYATAHNGDWFDDGQHLPIVDALAARLDQLMSGETFTDRREDGMRMAAAFDRPSFETDLKAAWDVILDG